MLKILLKIRAEEFKSPLPVDLRRSKTSWLKTLSSVFTNTLLSWSLEQLVWVRGGGGRGHRKQRKDVSAYYPPDIDGDICIVVFL